MEPWLGAGFLLSSGSRVDQRLPQVQSLSCRPGRLDVQRQRRDQSVASTKVEKEGKLLLIYLDRTNFGEKVFSQRHRARDRRSPQLGFESASDRPNVIESQCSQNGWREASGTTKGHSGNYRILRRKGNLSTPQKPPV